jgi:hypothetical protein
VARGRPRIRVRDRIPPLPWEPGYGLQRVGLEAGLEPEPGPLDFLRTVWPERYVVWNAEHQLWEVRQQNPVTQLDERVELLRRVVDAPDGYTVPAYLPFSYEWLLRRAENRRQFLTLGPAGYDDAVQERNRAQARRVIRDVAVYMADGLRELERYPGPGEWTPVPVSLKGSLCPS